MKADNSSFRKLVHISDQYISLRLKDSPFKYTELVALHYILRRESVSQEMLVKKLFVDKSTITKILKKFEKEQLIMRTPDPLDLRYKIIVPTIKLKSLKLEPLSSENDFYNFLFEGISEEDATVFYDFVYKLFIKARKETKDKFAHIISAEDKLGK